MSTINGMTVEAYEQYGIHPSPSFTTTCDWARAEERLNFERAVASVEPTSPDMQAWQNNVLRVWRKQDRRNAQC